MTVSLEQQFGCAFYRLRSNQVRRFRIETNSIPPCVEARITAVQRQFRRLQYGGRIHQFFINGTAIPRHQINP